MLASLTASFAVLDAFLLPGLAFWDGVALGVEGCLPLPLGVRAMQGQS
jgi:hypothetical protein